jgi:sugar (pentulose or hexulose) kinase
MKTGQLVGTLCADAAGAFGLHSSVKVYNGAHDQYCASLGCGAVNASDMLLSTGTAWVIVGISEKPIFSESYISSCPHPAEGGRYGNMLSLSGVGSSYQWIADTFFPGREFAQIDGELAGLIEKNRGLFFIPWLSGTGYPFWNSSAKGGFVGMDFSSGPYDMALAVMESAAFSFKAVLDNFEENGLVPSMLKIMGGASKSAIWMDIIRAVVDIPMYKMRVTDSCALGAAFIAACGEGWYRDYAAAAKAVVKIDEISEIKLDKEFYRQKYRCYRRMFGSFDRIYREGE